MEKAKQSGIKLYMAVIASVLATLGITIIVMQNMALIHSSANSSTGFANINVAINAHSFIVSYLYVNISGNGEIASVPIHILSRCIVYTHIIAPQPQANATEIPKIINESIQPCNETEYIIFTGLKPYAIYNVSISGTESPYCPPGIPCPMYIMRVYQTKMVETGPNNSIANVSFNV